MNSVLAKYEAKLKKAQMSRLKLSDVITIKKKLTIPMIIRKLFSISVPE